MRGTVLRPIWIIIAMVTVAFPVMRAQGRRTAGPPNAAAPLDVAATLRAAGNALGMLRFVNRVDTVGSLEFFGVGASAVLGPSEFYGSLSYPESAMRLVITRAAESPGTRGGARRGVPARGRSAAVPVPKLQSGKLYEILKTLPDPDKRIEVVNGKFAWDESELGAGLVPGQGLATRATATVKERQLLLWTLPHGIVKSAIKAGDKATIGTENGAAVITFPFADDLQGVTARVTFDAKRFPIKVETRADDPMLTTETTYSLYREFDVVETNVQFPSRIVRRRGPQTVLDIAITKTDTNNPYEVFPVPDAVK
jgi:hypothetical protein